jgi:DNA-binding LacI/PurR family transcriptional regulator
LVAQQELRRIALARRHNGDENGDTANNAREAPRPPTSTDVARLAGVSQSTVSHVLNDVPNNRFTQETRERVLAAAEELGYVPHAMARSLRFGRSNLVLIPVFDWPFNPDSFNFFQTLSTSLHDLGYTALLQVSSYRSDSILEAARAWAALRPVGIYIQATDLTRQAVEVLRNAGTQVILAQDVEVSPLVPTVLVDFTPVGECAAQHLAEKGHRHLAVLVPRDPRIVKLGLQRLRGVDKVARARGLIVDRVDIHYSAEEAASLAAKWKHDRGGRPTAVFTFNDEYGALLMGALQDAGLSIPGDIALVGCDDLPICEVLRPRLTSTDMFEESSVRELAAYVDAAIRGQQVGAPPRALAAPRLIVRESS